MAFNIQEFADNIGRYGTSPVNRFEVFIPMPIIFQSPQVSYDAETSELLTFRAERVNIPGIVLDTYDTRRYGVGPQIRTATGTSKFNEISVDFIDTSEMTIKRFFYDWMSNIVDIGGLPYPTFLSGYKADYCTDMTIRAYNSLGESVFNLDIIQAFPVSMTDNELAWSRTNELFKTSVIFAYTNHQPRAGAVEVEIQ